MRGLSGVRPRRRFDHESAWGIETGFGLIQAGAFAALLPRTFLSQADSLPEATWTISLARVDLRCHKA